MAHTQSISSVKKIRIGIMRLLYEEKKLLEKPLFFSETSSM